MRDMGLIRGACLALAAGTAATGVAAQDVGGVRQTFDVEQRFEFGRNLDLATPAEGSSSVAATVLSYGLFSETPLDRLAFTASGALVIENSPDTAGTEVDFGRPEVGFLYVREVPDALFSVALRYVSDDVSALADDLTVADATGTEIDYGVILRYEALRNSPVSIFVEATFDATEYEDTIDPTLIESDTYGLTAGTRLRFSEVMDGVFSLGVTREDDAAGVVADSFIIRAGVEYDMIDGFAAVFLTREEGDIEDSTSLEFDYTQDLPVGALSLGVTIAQTFDSGVGERTDETDIEIGWTQAINDASAIAVSLSWAQSDAPSEQITETELGATYSYALTEETSLDVGASFRERDDAGGRASSPLVFLALGRSF
jgi:hypothetical protein